jgi:desulfoferrodoxin (superoxide reductase-like protein)
MPGPAEWTLTAHRLYSIIKDICPEGNTMKKAAVAVSIILIRFFILDAYANASSVEITAPESAKQGSTITISVKVVHNANNIFHYTDWIWIRVNGKEIARWDFTWNHRPEDKVFIRTVTCTVAGPLVISSKSNCNLHGSAGERSVTVRIQ